MKIKPDVVLHCLDSLIAADPTLFAVAVDALVSAVRETTGVEVSRKVVREALDALEAAKECEIYKTERTLYVRRITKERRDAWDQAERLAEILGGTADKWTDARLATVSLTIGQADALVAKLKKGSL